MKEDKPEIVLKGNVVTASGKTAAKSFEKALERLMRKHKVQYIQVYLTYSFEGVE